MRPLVLAFSSPYRRELLSRLRVRFDVVAPGLAEEERANEPPDERARRLAVAKAQVIAQRYPEAIVIGSDQVAARGRHVLHKSAHAAGAREQLTALSGQAADFFTACALIGVRAGVHETHLDTTRVVFRELSRDEIGRYVEHDAPYDCAGSFKVESLGIALLAGIESTDPTALIGLPLIWIAQALRRCGYQLP
jgi:septum formation protein